MSNYTHTLPCILFHTYTLSQIHTQNHAHIETQALRFRMNRQRTGQCSLTFLFGGVSGRTVFHHKQLLFILLESVVIKFANSITCFFVTWLIVSSPHIKKKKKTLVLFTFKYSYFIFWRTAIMLHLTSFCLH